MPCQVPLKSSESPSPLIYWQEPQSLTYYIPKYKPQILHWLWDTQILQSGRSVLNSAMEKLNCRLSHKVWRKTTLISLEEFYWIPKLFPHLVDMNAKLIL